MRGAFAGHLEVDARGGGLAQGGARRPPGRNRARPAGQGGRDAASKKRLAARCAGLRRLAGRRPPAPLLDRGQEGERLRPWIVLVTSRTNDLVLATTYRRGATCGRLDLGHAGPGHAEADGGRRHRPTELQVRPDSRWDELGPHLEELGIGCVPLDTLDQLDFILESCPRRLAGDAPPALLEMPGVTPDLVAGFYQAAAEFYRRAPWRSLGYETAIKVECRPVRERALVRRRHGSVGPDLRHGPLRRPGAPQADVGGAALRRGERPRDRGPDASPSATRPRSPSPTSPPSASTAGRSPGRRRIPSIFRKERGMTMRPPLAWELELMEGCLRAVPDFVARAPASTTLPPRASPCRWCRGSWGWSCPGRTNDERDEEGRR